MKRFTYELHGEPPLITLTDAAKPKATNLRNWPAAPHQHTLRTILAETQQDTRQADRTSAPVAIPDVHAMTLLLSIIACDGIDGFADRQGRIALVQSLPEQERIFWYEAVTDEVSPRIRKAFKHMIKAALDKTL